jgi:hypothetical protein
MKHIFALSVVLSIAFPSKSQVGFGLKGGFNVNFATPVVSDDFDSEKSAFEIDNNIGMHLGGFAEIPLSQKFRFKPGITLIKKGGGDTDYERVSVYFTDVSPAFSYTPLKRFSIEIAPVLSYRIAATAYSWLQQKRVNTTSSIEAFNLGASAGINFSLSDKWSIAASASKSFNQSWHYSFRDEFNLPAGKVSYYLTSILVGVEYSFGGK